MLSDEKPIAIMALGKSFRGSIEVLLYSTAPRSRSSVTVLL